MLGQKYRNILDECVFWNRNLVALPVLKQWQSRIVSLRGPPWSAQSIWLKELPLSYRPIMYAAQALPPHTCSLWRFFKFWRTRMESGSECTYTSIYHASQKIIHLQPLTKSWHSQRLLAQLVSTLLLMAYPLRRSRIQTIPSSSKLSKVLTAPPQLPQKFKKQKKKKNTYTHNEKGKKKERKTKKKKSQVYSSRYGHKFPYILIPWPRQKRRTIWQQKGNLTAYPSGFPVHNSSQNSQNKRKHMMLPVEKTGKATHESESIWEFENAKDDKNFQTNTSKSALPWACPTECRFSLRELLSLSNIKMSRLLVSQIWYGRYNCERANRHMNRIRNLERDINWDKNHSPW